MHVKYLSLLLYEITMIDFRAKFEQILFLKENLIAEITCHNFLIFQFLDN